MRYLVPRRNCACTRSTWRAGNLRCTFLPPDNPCWWTPAIQGFNNRDADRIVAAAKAAGVTQIDYLVITHYHADHVGGVPQLAAKISIRNFVDHGQNFETVKDNGGVYGDYVAVRAKGNHIEVKAGDRIPIKGIDVEVVTASGIAIAKPLPGAGQPNPLCAAYKPIADGQRGERALHRHGDRARQVSVWWTWATFTGIRNSTWRVPTTCWVPWTCT